MRLKIFRTVLFILFMSACSGYAADVYYEPPSYYAPYYAGSVRSDLLYDALDELNYIRWLVGVPDNVALSEEMTRRAQHGAVLLDVTGRLSHTPGRPSDMPSSFYELGYDATTHSNLAQYTGGMTLNYALRLLMHDSDSYNISALGHRRWLMNPRMTRTGFGLSTRGGYAAVYVIDEADSYYSWPIYDEYITWPSSRHLHPLEYFDDGTAWSVTLNSDVFEPCYGPSVRVRLTRQYDGRTWDFGTSYSDGYFAVNSEGYAYDECIIFRPDDFPGYYRGDTWNVYITGLNRKDGRPGSLSYSVTFTGGEDYYDDNPPHSVQPRRDSGSSGGCSAGFGIAGLLLCLLFTQKGRRISVLVVMMAVIVPCQAFADYPYNMEPSFSPYMAGAVMPEVLNEALAEVNYARWLAGVPANITLNDEYTRRAQIGAVLLDANDELTHTPDKPRDMPQDFYEDGYDATSHGNIAYSKLIRGKEIRGNLNLVDTTKMYMEDTDGKNVGALGHRRWLLNPRLKQVGFGISTRRGYSVTYVIEEFPIKRKRLSRSEYAQYLDWLKWPIADEFIAWPSSKNPHPLSWFEPKTAWSVTLNRNVFEHCEAGKVSVRMTRINDGQVWEFGAGGNDGYFAVCPDDVAYDECLIFCPDDIERYTPGEYWSVEVTGLTRRDGGNGSFSYNVSFTI